jgi:glycosyltransferase involved in cell wall biosynthesis
VQKIRFSVVITCYNQRDFIRDAVDSALSQPVSEKEIIVVDDGSTDGSAHILEQYGNAIHFASLQQNRGAIEARNYGASLAGGKYIVFLDGDDALMPWALELYDRIITERNPMLILGQTLWFKGSIPPVRDEDVPRKIEFVEYPVPILKDRGVGLTASAFIVDRQAFQDMGGWTPGIFYLDLHDINIKLGFSGRMILICSPRTVFYREHSGNSIHSVPPFLRMAHHLMDKERAGQYPGGPEHRVERYAWLGGMLFFWVKRALDAGLYKEALKLAACGWTMIAAGVLRRCAIRIRGRRPIETIEFIHK